MSKTSEYAHYYSGGRGLTKTSISLVLEMQGFDPYAWFGRKEDVYPVRAVPYQRILWVVEGTIIIQLPAQDQEFTLNRGDRLDLSAGIPHQIIICSRRSICIEACGYEPIRREQVDLSTKELAYRAE
jgi:hypothetical protein